MNQPTRARVDWQAVKALLDGLGGKAAGRNGSTRYWRVPSPTSGTFTVEVTLRPRWCSIAIDRWRTTDRRREPSEAWFKTHIWPHVHEAVKTRRGYGVLPSGGGTFASATPIDRAVLLDLLDAWVRQELTWGLSHDEMGWLKDEDGKRLHKRVEP